jgi:hypothetical protein
MVRLLLSGYNCTYLIWKIIDVKPCLRKFTVSIQTKKLVFGWTLLSMELPNYQQANVLLFAMTAGEVLHASGFPPPRISMELLRMTAMAD